MIEDMQNNTTKKILIVLLTLAVVIAFVVLDALIIEPSRITVRRENLESEKIPKAMNGMQICYFSMGFM